MHLVFLRTSFARDRTLVCPTLRLTDLIQIESIAVSHVSFGDD
jgi:hypothetical protein